MFFCLAPALSPLCKVYVSAPTCSRFTCSAQFVFFKVLALLEAALKKRNTDLIALLGLALGAEGREVVRVRSVPGDAPESGALHGSVASALAGVAMKRPPAACRKLTIFWTG